MSKQRGITHAGRPEATKLIELAVQFVEQNYPVPFGSRTQLAKELFKKYRGIFKNGEQARYYVRKVFDSHQNSGRPTVTKVSGQLRQQNTVETQDNFHKFHFQLPESIGLQTRYNPYVLDIKKYNNVLVLADVHMRFHDEAALDLALSYGAKRNVNCILLLGDTVDFYAISRFTKEPSLDNLYLECEALKLFLLELRKKFPNALIILKEGNHEERWTKALITSYPRLYNMNIVSNVYEALKLHELGSIVYVGDKRVVKVGNLNCIHGHEYGQNGTGGVYVARNMWMRMKTNVMFGHFHRTDTYPIETANGDFMHSYSLGCLSQLSMDYAPKPFNLFNQGFAHVEVKENGDYNAFNFIIRNGRIV